MKQICKTVTCGFFVVKRIGITKRPYYSQGYLAFPIVDMILAMATFALSILGVFVNMYIIFHILVSDYQKTIFDLGLVNEQQINNNSFKSKSPWMNSLTQCPL